MQAGQFLGITAAPSYIDRSAAQLRMAALAREDRSDAGMTYESYDRVAARRELLNAMKRRDGTAIDLAKKAISAGTLNARDLVNVVKAGGKDRDAAEYSRLAIEGKLEVYKLGTAEEKKLFAPILLVGLVRALESQTPEEFQALREKFADVFRELLKRKAA
jgi:hypothetical protein